MKDTFFLRTFIGSAASLAARAIKGDRAVKTLLRSLQEAHKHIVLAGIDGDKVLADVVPADAVIDDPSRHWTSEVVDHTAAVLINECKGHGEIMPGLWA